MPALPAAADVVVIGGGPAGVAAAFAARRHGFSVAVIDRAIPPIDKACGEGLMPDGVAALRTLGVAIAPDTGAPFRGIRFIDKGRSAEAYFGPSANAAPGLGMRRTALHRLLVAEAEAAGIAMCWGTRAEGLYADRIWTSAGVIRCRWIVGADGLHSRVRQWAGFAPGRTALRRVGLRRHYTVRPWTDMVEVHWHSKGQAYVTPISRDEVCVALVGAPTAPSFADLGLSFPRLARRLADATAGGPPRGALSVQATFPAVTRRNVVLIGDASGSVDAVTGEGLALALRQAGALGAALAAADMPAYEAAHRRICRLPRLMGRLLTTLGAHDTIRGWAIGGLAASPWLFAKLLALHIGGGARSDDVECGLTSPRKAAASMASALRR